MKKTDKDRPQKAVALTYDMGSDPAPKIVAKGHGPIAEQIIKIAEENGIAIHTDADLVEILAVLELDSFIPLEAYTAVAEILRYIYSAGRK
jgi:flagellar biosynthesis protein